jgi:hypothetical protein
MKSRHWGTKTAFSGRRSEGQENLGGGNLKDREIRKSGNQDIRKFGGQKDRRIGRAV